MGMVLSRLRLGLTSAGGGGGVTWATVTGTTGSPTIHSDVDGDGLWDAYEFTASGSITLTAGKVGRRLWQGGGAHGEVASSIRGAGGGAGGWTEQDNTELEIAAGTYSIVVGAGATQIDDHFSLSADGSTTSAMGVSAPGGGAGARADTGVPGRNGGNGGGGAGGNADANAENAGGSGDPGFDGGAGLNRRGGGGGGSGGAGQSAGESFPGDGGLGIDSDILGGLQNFGAGGGASMSPAAIGAAGGSSATPGRFATTRVDASANRGGGCGGVSSDALADRWRPNAGSGVFIVRIRRAA